MKSKWIIAVLALAMSLVGTACAQTTTDTGTGFAAPDRVWKLDLGVYGAHASNDAASVDDGGFIGLNMSLGLLPWLAVGVEGGWQEVDGASDEEVGYGTVLGDIILRLPLEYVGIQDVPVVPYTLVGFGVMGTYVVDENGIGPTNNGDDTDDRAFAWKWGIGADWFVMPNLAIFGEIGFYSSDPDELTSSSIRGEDAEFWTFGGGAKLVF